MNTFVNMSESPNRWRHIYDLLWSLDIKRKGMQAIWYINSKPKFKQNLINVKILRRINNLDVKSLLPHKAILFNCYTDFAIRTNPHMLKYNRPFNPLWTRNPWTGPFANIEDPDEMPYNEAFHQDLHCILRLKSFIRGRHITNDYLWPLSI